MAKLILDRSSVEWLDITLGIYDLVLIDTVK